MERPLPAALLLLSHLLLQLMFIARVLQRPHREPAARIALVVVILAFSVLGIAAYILFGETNLGRSRVERMRAILGAASRSYYEDLLDAGVRIFEYQGGCCTPSRSPWTAR